MPIEAGATAHAADVWRYGFARISCKFDFGMNGFGTSTAGDPARKRRHFARNAAVNRTKAGGGTTAG